MTELLKVHGSQNSFFILDQTTLANELSDDQLRQLAKQVTDHQKGLLGGADGLLVVNHPTREGASAQMRVINADGSEASMCGNGLRTVARYLAERDHRTTFKVDTMNSNLQVRQADNLAASVPAFAVEISPVHFDKAALPFDHLGHDRLLGTMVPELAPQLTFSAIAVPNPHLISFVSQAVIEGPLLGELGAYLNGDNPYFSDGVNVNFAQILGPNKLFVRTFERGVGFTNACGTGMSATTLAFVLLHANQAAFNEPITVYNPGGMVKTIVHFAAGHYWIELIGNATFTHRITVGEAALHAGHVTADNSTINPTGEQEAYEQFIHQLPSFNLSVKD
ncbi:diaminopimelate epimerase [Limosilactobacillus panis]|uniref:Diaminopimelate epimerase n=1 Tax=Limosilactobacillus panis TaxID=47493 RepID=A0ABT7VKR7_9LACO|nr:diaminopimelate epimerase [Limosilactobacillus panis]MDM8333329.1 diaminopimelate epimerase [Limosilactobacillus panis]HJA21281.1 diaminopimelate epimerase [Candidatus Limosilactobacillus intestinipullorum]